VDNDQLLAYSKVDAVTGNAVLVVVNLDPRNAQEGTITVDLPAIGQQPGASYGVTDAVTGATWTWGERNFVRLVPTLDVAHVLVLPTVPEQRREALAWRRVEDYRA